MVRFIGIDPGLRKTGWGIISLNNNCIRHISSGIISSTHTFQISDRLKQIYAGLLKVFEIWFPDTAIIETIFTNTKNLQSSLKLAHARSVCLLVPALFSLPIFEYTPTTIKNTVAGFGHATKDQIVMMIERILPRCTIHGHDSADALAIAICHVHHLNFKRKKLEGDCKTLR